MKVDYKLIPTDHLEQILAQQTPKHVFQILMQAIENGLLEADTTNDLEMVFEYYLTEKSYAIIASENTHPKTKKPYWQQKITALIIQTLRELSSGSTELTPKNIAKERQYSFYQQLNDRVRAEMERHPNGGTIELFKAIGLTEDRYRTIRNEAQWQGIELPQLSPSPIWQGVVTRRRAVEPEVDIEYWHGLLAEAISDSEKRSEVILAASQIDARIFQQLNPDLFTSLESIITTMEPAKGQPRLVEYATLRDRLLKARIPCIYFTLRKNSYFFIPSCYRAEATVVAEANPPRPEIMPAYTRELKEAHRRQVEVLQQSIDDAADVWEIQKILEEQLTYKLYRLLRSPGKKDRFLTSFQRLLASLKKNPDQFSASEYELLYQRLLQAQIPCVRLAKPVSSTIGELVEEYYVIPTKFFNEAQAVLAEIIRQRKSRKES
jgi:hypothetical protein